MNEATADHLATAGRFSDALRALSASTKTVTDALFRAELLERTGNYDQSKELALSVLRSKSATPADLAVCESILGLVDWREGNVGSSILRLQRAASISSEASQLERSCWCRLRVLVLVCDQEGPDAAVTLLPPLRTDILRSGSIQLLAALHIFLGETEGKRGLLKSAIKHLQAGKDLLSKDPNAWLEASAENSHTAALILSGKLDEALTHGSRALTVAEQSGGVHVLTASLANLGNLFFRLGRFTEATEYLSRATALQTISPEHSVAIRDTLAHIYLAEGDADKAEQALDQIDRMRPSHESQSHLRYVFRHSQLTRIKVLAFQNRFSEAIRCASELTDLAERSGDVLLRASVSVTKAELLIGEGNITEALPLLEEVVPELYRQSATLQADYETALALANARAGTREAAAGHTRIATRLAQYRSAGPVKQFEVSIDKTANLESSASSAARTVLRSLMTMLLHTNKPSLIAEQLLDLVQQCDCCERARFDLDAVVEHDDYAHVKGEDASPTTFKDMLALRGTDTQVRFHLQPKADVESRATVNAIALVLQTIQELEVSRLEREKRLTLWPAEDVPLLNDDAIIGGKMRDILATVRKVASTNIGVLLTGESGTGKEILARAIHTFSDRADRPFVPFNCAAVPRDMLESQLFGHRRGAFTGADRDNPGVIRAARGGTLFLDEIGELSPALQPKLLRFLESGEILPLGETTPATVSVRIVAATNAKLEDAVKAGRFREDLFYRLNVVRLQIPPLRERRDELPALVQHFVSKAAVEFRKGQVRIAENTMERLLIAPWPGNIRQLQNEIRRMIALADADAVLMPDALSAEIAGDETAAPAAAFVPPAGKLHPALARVEREMIKAALEQHRGKMDAAARSLGISRKGLYLKRQRLGL